jgi:NAD(P)-dependent dehydrogenase (short-subunit alcohol dehydrogenase family)
MEERQMNRLEGKAALVTGAAGGIAGATARRFAAEGAAVACLDIDDAGAARTAGEIEAAGGRALACPCDVSDAESVRASVARAAEAFGRLDIVVNGAALGEAAGNVVELDLAEWQRALATNLTSVFLVCKYAIPVMATSGGGSVINIASQLGQVAVPRRPAYVTTKAAVIQLTRSMAIDFAKDNIRVNSLSPGATETPRLLRTHKTMEDARAALVPLHPIGRLGQPADLADAALFLASDESRFMTGADLVVDGGYTAI